MILSDTMVKTLVDSQREGLDFLEGYDRDEVQVIRQKPAKITFLDAEDIIRLHEWMGMFGDLRSMHLLESSLARARQAATYAEPTMKELATLVAEGIIRNHPFVDGNKRTAQLALCAFLAVNGESCPEDPVRIGEIILGLSTKEITVEDAGQYLSLCKQSYFDLPSLGSGQRM